MAGYGSPDLRGRVKLFRAELSPPGWKPLTDGLPPDLQKVEIKPRLAANAPGVSWDASTGKVIVPAASFQYQVRNFLLEATLTYTDAGKKHLRSAIRVHVHRSVEKVWLTPDLLEIREDETSAFTVLAEFDDGVVADLSNVDGLKWFGGDHSAIQVGSDPSLPPMAPRTGPFAAMLYPQKVTDPGAVDIWIELPAEFGGKRSDQRHTRPPEQTPQPGPYPAQARSIERWGKKRTVTLISGPGAEFAGDVPNVLILPEGFTESQAKDFRRLARALVSHLRVAQSTRPFDLLADKINFWMMFVPSRQAGLTIRNGVEVTPDPPHDAWPSTVPDPPPPAEAPDEEDWGAERMLYEVGLPTPADADATLQTKLPEWKAVYGPQVENHLRILFELDPVVRHWRDHTVTLLNEVDTAFGLAAGERPNFSDPGTYRTIDWNRRTRIAVDKFLKELVAKQPDGTEVKIGETWVSGRDKDKLYFLLGGSHRVASMGKTVGGSSLVDSRYMEVAQVSNSRALDIKPHELPGRTPTHAIAVFAHELGHALGLGDEYAEIDTDLPTALEGWANSWPNLQTWAPLVQPPQPLPPNDQPPQGGIWGQRIKWLWPRIDKAAILTKEPEDGTVAGRFKISVKPGHDLKKDDIVRLRPHALVAGMKWSSRLKVWMANATEVHVEPAANEPALTIAQAQEFGAADLLIRPVRAPAPEGAPEGTYGDDYLLVAPAIRRHITRSGGPLDVEPDNHGHATRDCSTRARKPDENPNDPWPRKASNLPPIGPPYPEGLPRELRPPRRPKYSPWFVGLFEGGARYACRIYHPTGVCLMADAWFTPRDPRTWKRIGPDRVYQFCPVCRYILVDKVDPTKHGRIDADYERRYPAPDRAPPDTPP